MWGLALVLGCCSTRPVAYLTLVGVLHPCTASLSWRGVKPRSRLQMWWTEGVGQLMVLALSWGAPSVGCALTWTHHYIGHGVFD